jgi:hypothetical protein
VSSHQVLPITSLSVEIDDSRLFSVMRITSATSNFLDSGAAPFTRGFPKIRRKVDVALIREPIGSNGLKHLLDDGYTREQVQEIRRKACV